MVGYFADASPLDPGSQIRVSGVNVGTVEAIELDGGRARVTFDVETSVLPVHEDASMVIRPVNLLGENYVELRPGSPSKELVDSTTIPIERTSTRVTLEDVLNTFDAPTSTALAALTTTLGEGMDRSGAEAAQALKALAPAMADSERLARILREQNAVLGSLIEQTDPVARALATNDGRVLDRLVGHSEQLLRSVAVNRAALDQTMKELPATVVTARRTLDNLARTADSTTPMLRGLRPITEDLPQLAQELHAFSDAADPALTSLTPVLRRAHELLVQAGPVVRALRRSGSDLRAVASSARPLGDVAVNRHLGDLMAFVKKWALATNGRDALGNYFRGAMWIAPETLAELGQDQDAATAGRRPPADQAPGIDLGGLLGSAGPDTDHNGATGLTLQQELSLVDQLLGGS